MTLAEIAADIERLIVECAQLRADIDFNLSLRRRRFKAIYQRLMFLAHTTASADGTRSISAFNDE